jgi:arylsulfatase A-like enzyme
MSNQRNYPRCLLSTASGFLFTMLVICAWKTWQQYGQQGWTDLGYQWLGWDLWSRAWEIKEALAGAVLTLVLALTGEFFAKSSSPMFRLIRWGNHLASRIWVVGLLALIGLGVPKMIASFTQPDAPNNAPNILYVMVDTWRADHVGWLGYERDVTPGLDELVKSGVVFENVVSPAGWTKPSVGTQLTGLIPSFHQAVSQPIPSVPVHGTKLPYSMLTWMEVLRANGWDTGMWSNNPNILPIQGFDQGAGYFVDYVNHPDREGWTEDPDGIDPGRSERMLPEVREWMDNSWDRDRPFAAYVHVMDPHYPYVAPAPFKGTFDQTGLDDLNLDGIYCGDFIEGRRKRSEITQEMLERINGIYDEEILYVDHYLTPFLKGVMEEFPNTYIVLVSDHGEEFMEHGFFGHGQSIYSELVNVPLVIWGPDLDGQRVKWQVRLMDLFPTILDFAGLEAPSKTPLKTQGETLVDMGDGHRMAPMDSGGDERPPWHWRGMSDGEWKMIYRLEVNPADHQTQPNGIPVLNPESEANGDYFEIYRISEDPNEQNNLVDTEIQRARSLFGVMERNGWYADASAVNKFGTSSDLGASLQALVDAGYLDPSVLEGKDD